MTATFEELLVFDGNTKVGAGTAPLSNTVYTTVRRFKVPAETPALAATNPELLTAAGSGVAHPTIPGLVSLGPTIGQRGGSGDDTFYYATVEYGITGTPTFNFPAPDRTNAAFVSAGFAPFVKEVDFPIYTERTIAAPMSGGVSKEWVKVEGKTIRVPCMAYTMEFNSDSLSPADIGAIYAQQNKIHEFYGGVWLFKPQSASITYREGYWTIIFRWESDPGTSAAELAEIESDPRFCEVAERPPHALWFEVFDVVYPETDAGPRLISKVMYQSIPTGYESLPGYGSIWSL